ncbi:Rpn family recombination-promoting nuclease/putative transposase [Candidatus Sodalis sp. SoCistrobi]|uniref:Rpn family recombination-promoting nuclease/putative transposase n=1 Tax=Candidatus Sodalis sp. SoCistrobi TaxID=1922216 RepID=UPI00093B5BB5|nr:Rpn family recombination-promoting nuclease/putative transposase [Candidatus Sodalis sp. SoCistrobi]
MSTSSLSQHDALFKKFLGDIAVARDFLEIHLPPHLRERCDFGTLAMESGSFIEDDLKGQCSDMLYSMKTTTGHDGYVYCLIEHQSRPEKLMAFRLMRYAVAAMQRHLEQGNDSLPVVIPLLFYHGTTSPYPYSTQWLDCFTDPELVESVYRQAFPLVDITAMPDDEILSHRRVALLELVQKHIRTRDMLELATDIARLLNLWAIPKEQFRSLMYYIVGRGETSNTRQFLHTIAAQTQDYQEDVMTIAEQLRQEGEQKGIQKGIQLGEQKGRQEGLQEGEKLASLKIAQHMLSSGLARDAVKQFTGLSDHELDDLLSQ